MEQTIVKMLPSNMWFRYIDLNYFYESGNTIDEDVLYCIGDLKILKKILKYQKVSEKFLRNALANNIIFKNDLKYIAYIDSLSEEFIDEYSTYISWTRLVKSHRLYPSLLSKYAKQIKWNEYLKTFKLSDEEIRNLYSSKNAILMYKHQEIPEDLIRKVNSLSLKKLAIETQKLPIDLIEEFVATDKELLNLVFEYQNVSNEFILNNLPDADNEEAWEYISENQKLSHEFIKLCHDKLDWYNVSRHQNLTIETIDAFKNKIEWNWYGIHNKVSDDIILKYHDELDWNILSRQTLSLEIKRKFKDKIIWNYVNDLTMDTIEEFIDHIDWGYINYRDLSEDFIIKHIDKVDWECLTPQSEQLSDTFFCTYGEFIHWDIMTKYCEISYDVIKHNIKYIAKYADNIIENVDISDNVKKEFIKLL